MASKYADDGFTQGLIDYLEKRISQIQEYVDNGTPIPRDDLGEFVWKTTKQIRISIKPEKGKVNTKAWNDAKGMLKGVIDFTKFSLIHKDVICVLHVQEAEVLSCFTRYRHYLMTGEVETVHVPPKLLGETDEVLIIDKPCRYTCGYGDSNGKAPQLMKLESASALLNSPLHSTIQIHEYIAMKFDFETAQKTREWWVLGKTELDCKCGKCSGCAATQTGCCNRLDKETSGVMITAKTLKGFPIIRQQFASEHSLEAGGTEKYYLALVHGSVKLPTRNESKHINEWNHGLEENPKHDARGRIQVNCVFDDSPEGRGTAKAFDKGNGESAHWLGLTPKKNSQWAITFYEPIAWFTHNDTGEELTLLQLQIITGRRHQIRFHCAEIGHTLVGDGKYDQRSHAESMLDRVWSPRIFLHSYCSKFREPFTERWFEATSPLPQDLGDILEKHCTLLRVKSPWTAPPLLSRRYHPQLTDFLKQYDQTKKPLLYTTDISKEQKEAALATVSDVLPGIQKFKSASNGSPARKKRRIIVPKQFANLAPRTPPLPPRIPQAAPPRQPQYAPPADPVAPAGLQPTPAGMPGMSAGLPQAYQSPAELGWTRMQSRSQPGVFYYFNSINGATQAEPPPPWELKASRSNASVVYYWNTVTGATSPEKPEVL